LVVRQAHLAHKDVPAWIVLELREKRIGAQAAQATVALLTPALQPFESPILVPAIRVNLGDLVCRRIGESLG
jgi:hypothetical protein